MRIAAIADIHGNLRALEAVLTDVAAHAPDLILSLGDTVSGPLEAAETADLLMARGFPTVRGNHDRHLIHPPPGGTGTSDRGADARRLPHHLDWIAALPATLRPAPAVLAFHGRPDNDMELATGFPWRAPLTLLTFPPAILCGPRRRATPPHTACP